MLSLRLFHPALWNLVASYRAIPVCLRMAELLFITLRFLFIRAPLLIIWTRFPGLRGRTPPYSRLAEILGPERKRPPVLIQEQSSITLGEIKTKEELFKFIQTARRQSEQPRSTIKIISGGIVRGLLTELGPVFIKFGHIMSMSAKVPSFLREELQLLQDNVYPEKPEDVQKALRREMKELGSTVEETFEWVDANPIACASLAQVHRAKLRTGELVALKIQRPRMEALVWLDTAVVIWIFMDVIRRVYVEIRKMSFEALQTALSTCMRQELDFYYEGVKQRQISDKLMKESLYSRNVKIAKVYPELSTKKLLTMELVEGFHRIDRLPELEPDKLWDLLSTKLPEYPEEYPAQLFRVMCAVMGDVLIDYGFVQPDLHAGNVYFVEPQEGYGWRVFFCDFGAVRELYEVELQWVRDWFRAVVWMGDAEEMVRVTMRNIDRSTLDKLDKEHAEFAALTAARYSNEVLEEMRHVVLPPDSDAYTTNMREFLQKRRVKLEGNDAKAVIPIRERGVATTGEEVVTLLTKFAIPFNTDTVLEDVQWMICKSLIYIEGLGSALWIGASWNDMFIHALKRVLKDEIYKDLDSNEKHIANLRNYVGEISDLLRKPVATSLISQSSKKGS